MPILLWPTYAKLMEKQIIGVVAFETCNLFTTPDRLWSIRLSLWNGKDEEEFLVSHSHFNYVGVSSFELNFECSKCLYGIIIMHVSLVGVFALSKSTFHILAIHFIMSHME